MSNLSDPEAIIKGAEPGTMIYGRTRFDGGAWETALYVREEKRYIDGFGRAPVVELRWMSVDDGSGVVLAALVRFHCDHRRNRSRQSQRPTAPRPAHFLTRRPMQAIDLIHRYYFVILSRRVYRRDDGAVMLATVGVAATHGRLGEPTEEELRLDEIARWEERRGDQWVERSAPGYSERYSADVRRVYAPTSDADLAQLQRKHEAAEETDLDITSWPTPTYAARVMLAGSRDRWVAAIGEGGYLEHIPGTWGTAAEAEAAVRRHLEQLRAEAAAGVGAFFAPLCRVRCVFPAIRVDVLDDAAQTFALPPNRAARRAAAAALGALGGKATSDAKAAAARANGAKGGRPRKTAT